MGSLGWANRGVNIDGMPWREFIEDDIETVYNSLLQAVKAEDEARPPVDAHQLCVDVDYHECPWPCRHTASA